MKFREENLPSCATENVPLFVMYIRKELPREQEIKLDRHIQQCNDCRANFAYIEEIINCKHLLSSDEKTLLLKYISDPLWYYSINRAKKQILSEVNELLKEANANLVKANSNINNTNLLSNPVLTIGSNKDNKPSPKLLLQKSSLLLVTALILVFFSLSTGIYLVINKQHSSFNNTPLSISPTYTPINVNQNNISTTSIKNNLYEQLDSTINQYLDLKDGYYLEQAEKIAQKIEDIYQDKYGIDLVNYYRSAPVLAIDKLSLCRKEMFALMTKSHVDHYQEILAQSEKLQKELFSLGNIIEAYRVKTITNKFYVFLYKYELSEKTSAEGIKFSTDNNYSFLQAHFLLWQAKRLSTDSNFQESEKAFQQAISVSEKLELDELIASGKTSLSTIYHLNDYNEKSLEITQNLLAKPERLNKDRIVSLLQVCGLSAFSLQYYDLSDYYLKQSLDLATDLKNPALLARSYLFLSLISSEAGKFQHSDEYHSKAIALVEQLEDKTSRLSTLFAITGYYAKSKARQGDFSQAAIAYKQALETINQLGSRNNLVIGQLNEGLAIALKELNNPSEAQQYTAMANHYRKLANNNKEKANCLLSFVPQPCYAK